MSAHSFDSTSPRPDRTETPYRSSTRAVHSGAPRPQPHHALTTPIFQTATFTFDNTADLLQFLDGHSAKDRLEYGRYGNPTITAVERKLADLDGGQDAVLFASGMSALTSVLLAVLPAGAHIVMTDDSYRRTRQFCETYLCRLGITTTIVPMGDYTALEAAIQPGKTRFLISENPTNPYLRIADLERIAAIGRQHRVITLIDSTFATPVNQQPLAWGIDLVVHSATKYLAGHNDLLAGVVVGSGELIQTIREARGIFGSIIDPQSAFLLERGLKTLAIRVRQQNATAQAVATYLEQHARIERVWYPGLESHPDHATASRQMHACGGVVSFEVETDMAGTIRFIDALQIPVIAPSLGGVESLIEQPALIGYYDLPPAERAALGIRDNLVRFAIGIEDAEDILADLEQALRQI
ncbi:MAG: aminotransferase class I/II-fold pyridoxal phosphate-dependent enzyme [Anaerolineae bacterium]|nr:aminotransferase class I/II-fold pyridoxal phosphate-dependent enzyme [Anaerolineae bacterium]